MKRTATVIGAGVIGLTTAVTLAEDGHRVQVITDQASEHTTSAVAGALWGPWLVQPERRVLPWAHHTLTVLTELAAQPGTGIRIASGIDVANTSHPPLPWMKYLLERRPCTPAELPDGYTHGHHYAAPLVDMPMHLTYLRTRLAAAGAGINHQHITSLKELAHDAPLIINCSGLGSHALTDDHTLYPIQGYHLVVTNPGLTDFIEADTGDSPDLIAIYPHHDHVILGGTAHPNVWHCEPDPETEASILARCATIEPRLHNTTILEHRVGLRPTRPTIRLEVEVADRATVIHNYGHGGAGVSLSWGCAQEVSGIVNTLAVS